jgi:succinyl-diaminopimelate desuccinylase
MDSLENTIFSFIDHAETLAVELETGLCARPAISPDSGGEGELDKAEYLEAWMRGEGFSFKRIDIRDDRAKGKVRPNIVVDLGGGAGTVSGTEPPQETGCLWIMSHLDVVPPGEAAHWESDPWKLVRKDDPPLGPRIIGRGVEDNQQGLVSSLIAAKALKAAGAVPSRPVKLLFCADEECGSSYGVGALLREHPELFHKDDLVLIPDGGDSRGETIEIAEKNCLWIEFVTKGKQSHGSRPDLGINACLAGSDLMVQLYYGLTGTFNARDPLFEPPYSTFEPTKKYANVPNINTIPGEDISCMDARILPQYPIKAVLEEIDRIKAEIEAKYRVSVTYKAPQSLESKATPADSPLVALLSRAVEKVYGLKTRLIGIGGGTVGALLRNEGIHCAVWSRMDDTAHQPNEYALIGNILDNAKTMILLMI